jgi:hypothetical protein
MYLSDPIIHHALAPTSRLPKTTAQHSHISVPGWVITAPSHKNGLEPVVQIPICEGTRQGYTYLAERQLIHGLQSILHANTQDPVVHDARILQHPIL